MKKQLLLLFVIPLAGIVNAQVKTTIQDGVFFNPFIWDCSCIPGDGDTLVINHEVQMTTSIAYTSGQITVNNGGSLVEDGTDRDLWINGGSLINHGTIEARDLWLNSGFVTNSGVIGPLDSVWVQGDFTNSGTLLTYDILTDENGSFDNSGALTITNNFNNQGPFLNSGSVTVANDFSNCNTQSMNAIFTNNNIMCITNDFSNCADDTLVGSGDYYIGGSSANLGVFDGTFTFHTPSGTLGITGDVQPGVTVTTGACALGNTEMDQLVFEMYPNPASDVLNVTLGQFEYEIINYTGAVVANGIVFNGQIDLSQLLHGVYWLNVTLEDGQMSSKKFVKFEE